MPGFRNTRVGSGGTGVRSGRGSFKGGPKSGGAGGGPIKSIAGREFGGPAAQWAKQSLGSWGGGGNQNNNQQPTQLGVKQTGTRNNAASRDPSPLATNTSAPVYPGSGPNRTTANDMIATAGAKVATTAVNATPKPAATPVDQAMLAYMKGLQNPVAAPKPAPKPAPAPAPKPAPAPAPKPAPAPVKPMRRGPVR